MLDVFIMVFVVCVARLTVCVCVLCRELRDDGLSVFVLQQGFRVVVWVGESGCWCVGGREGSWGGGGNQKPKPKKSASWACFDSFLYLQALAPDTSYLGFST